MRIPFFNRVTARKLTVKTTGPEAPRIAEALQAILTQLPDLQLLYLADNKTAEVLAFYTKASTLMPGPLAQESAALHRHQFLAPGQAAGSDTILREAVYVFDQQLHFSSACRQAQWHWGLVVPLPDISLALVRVVMRDQNQLF